MTKRRRKRQRLTAADEKVKIEAFLLAPKKAITKLPPAYAKGAEHGPSVKPRARKRGKE